MLKSVSVISFVVGVLHLGAGVTQYVGSLVLSTKTDMSAIQVTQVASQSTFAVVCGLWFVLFGFAVGAIIILREIRTTVAFNKGVVPRTEEP